MTANPEHTIHENTQNLKKRHEPMLIFDALDDRFGPAGDFL